MNVLQDYQGNESCKEVAMLYRAANKMIKTLHIAKTAMLSGDGNAAILNYNEVASIFLEKNSFSKNSIKSDLSLSLSSASEVNQLEAA
jgi:hypothetical protein